PFADLNSGRASILFNDQVTSPAPPAVGLSPESLIKKGCFLLFKALFKLPSRESTGATNPNFDLTSQKLWAKYSAEALTFSLLSPVTITTAWFRGSSAHAYPIHIPASITPSFLVMGGIKAYK